jgi:ankyrin repeat protein
VLIRAGARVSAADDTGVTPIYLACTNRSRAMVEKLLAAGANPNAALLNGETALMTCARTGEVGAVKALLARGAAVNAKEPSRDQTALMWAAAQKHPDVVAALLERGADVRARSRVYAQTVTSEVTQRAGREALNYQSQRGGSTPLLFAARPAMSIRTPAAGGRRGRQRRAPERHDRLVEAAHSGHQAVGILLLNSGADANAANVGYTALHAAVLRGGLDLVKALLAHGAKPDAQITKGTPVRRNSEDFELPATLIGATPYLLAAKFLEPDIMHVLAAAHANTRRPMKTGETPLMAAAGVGAAAQLDRRGVSLLDGGKLEPEGLVVGAVAAAIAHGSDLNAVNQAGDTALHGAAALGYNRVIQLLIDGGTGQTCATSAGDTVWPGRREGGATRAPDRVSRTAPQSTADLRASLAPSSSGPARNFLSNSRASAAKPASANAIFSEKVRRGQHPPRRCRQPEDQGEGAPYVLMRRRSRGVSPIVTAGRFDQVADLEFRTETMAPTDESASRRRFVGRRPARSSGESPCRSPDLDFLRHAFEAS